MARTRRRRNYYVPEEITSSILSLLPVRSLLRFRAVCKLWKSIISNNQFIQTHLDKSKEKRPSIVSLPSVWLDGVDSVIFIDTLEKPVGLYLPPEINFMISHLHSCNGLVCFANSYANVIYLCNLSTKRFKIIPTPGINSVRMRLVIGFWFDSMSNDYKILRIVLYLTDLAAEVYSENSQSWKEIQVPKTVQSFRPRLHSKCVHTKTGMLYFDGDGSELLSFNPHNEVFEVYQFPESVGSNKRSNVLDFEGSVAMIFDESNESVYSLWTLDDVCGKVSWTKKFNLETDFMMDRVVLNLGFGQYVVVIGHINGSIIYYRYDFRKKKAKKFPSLGLFGEVASVVKYSESLISLDGF